MRNLLLERRALIEGYFDNNVERGVDTDDIIQSGNMVEETKDVSSYKYYFEIVYSSSDCRNTNFLTDNSYIVNIQEMYKKVCRIFDTVDIVYDYYVAPPVIYDSNNYFKAKEFTFPLPTDFDIIQYVDSVNGNKYSMSPLYTFRVFFNEFPKYSYKLLAHKIEGLQRMCFKLFLKYQNDYGKILLYKNDGKYNISMVFHKEHIAYEISFSHTTLNDAVRRLYLEMYNKQPEYEESDEDVKRRISKRIDLKEISKNAVTIAKDVYGFILTPVKTHKAKFNPWQDVFTWLSFDMKFPDNEKSYDIYKAEECVYNSIIKQLPSKYLSIVTLLLFIRVDGKLIIPEDENGGKIFNGGTTRHYQSSPFRCQIAYNRHKMMPKIRKCTYRMSGAGEDFFIFFCDKKGNIMRNYDNFGSSYTKMYFNDTVLKCLRDKEAWE